MRYDETMKVDIPEMSLGKWQVEKFTVTEEQAKIEACRAIFSGRGCMFPGTYTRLVRNNEHGRALVMSDTPDEVDDHFVPIRKAVGHCLINGLGLGVVVNGMLCKSEVDKVTVVEYDSALIDLVGAYWKDIYGDRLEIVHADALEYKPPRNSRFSVVWHDIWDTICADNLPEMHKLHRKYGKRADWQGSWCRELCEEW